MQENTVKSIWRRGGTAVNGSVDPTGALWHGADDVNVANHMALTFAMIETRKAMNAAKAAVGAMREGNVTGAKSAGGSWY